MVELVPVTAANWRRALDVRVPARQLPFVAAHQPVALVILSKAYVRAGDVDWWPYLIEDDGRVVGVLALTDERAVRRELGLFHLVVDATQQGRGLGRAAVAAVLAFADELAGVDRVRLTVHPDNAAALALYRSHGFEPDGHDADGELRMARTTASGRRVTRSDTD